MSFLSFAFAKVLGIVSGLHFGGKVSVTSVFGKSPCSDISFGFTHWFFPCKLLELLQVAIHMTTVICVDSCSLSRAISFFSARRKPQLICARTKSICKLLPGLHLSRVVLFLSCVMVYMLMRYLVVGCLTKMTLC